MPQCPVCQQSYSEDEVKSCLTCGWDLTPYPLTFAGQIPEAFINKEKAKLAWAKQCWQKCQSEWERCEEMRVESESLRSHYESTISQLSWQLDQTHQERQQNFQQINQQLESINQKQISADDLNSFTRDVTQELANLSQQLVTLQSQLESRIPTGEPSAETAPKTANSTLETAFSWLEKSLKQQNWLQADLTTTALLCEILHSKDYNSLVQADPKTISGQDICKLNELWLDYSDGKFGFKVQKYLYHSLTRVKSSQDQFFKSLGWMEKYISSYTSLPLYPCIFDLKTAPLGHFPSLSTGYTSDPKIALKLLKLIWSFLPE